MAKKETENSLAVRETSEVGFALPDFIKNDALAMSGFGTEELSSGDLTIPRLAIAQDTHDQIKNPNKRIKGLSTGDFFNTLTKEFYKQGPDGDGPLLVTVLFAKKNRRYFTPRDEGSKTLCVSANGINGGRYSKTCATCNFKEFSYDNENGKLQKPKCTLFYNYVLIIHHKDGRHFTPVMLSLKSKMVQAAKDWNSLLRTATRSGLSSFTLLYEISTFFDESSSAGGFHNLRIVPADVIRNEQAFKNAKAVFESLQDSIAEVINKTQEQAANEEDVLEAELEADDAPF